MNEKSELVIHTITWMNLKNVMSEKSHTQDYMPNDSIYMKF